MFYRIIEGLRTFALSLTPERGEPLFKVGCYDHNARLYLICRQALLTFEPLSHIQFLFF